MPSPEAEKLIGKLRKYKHGDAHDLEQMRDRVEDSGKLFSQPENVTVETVDVDGIRGVWLTPENPVEGAAIYYLHGDGYVLGSIESHRHMVAELARATDVRVLMIDYRLAPGHPFPAAVDDGVKGFNWLLTQGYDAPRIAIAGDSAGGGLSLATMISLRESDSPLPGCALLMSPWTDLTNSMVSRKEKSEDDLTLTIEHLFADAD